MCATTGVVLVFHDGVPEITASHRQFCERKDATHEFFDRHEQIVFILTESSAAQKTRLLYKRRKRKGMCISGIDGLKKLWDYWCGSIHELEG